MREACEEHGIETGAVVTGIGTLRNLNVHYLHADVRTESAERNTFLELDGFWELTGIDGLIADGEPHLHVAAFDGDRTIVGHLEEGNEVNALAEILLRKLDGPSLKRRPDEYDVSTLKRDA